MHTPGLSFDIRQLVVNPSGKLLAVAGSHQVAVVVLPRPGYMRLVPTNIDCKCVFSASVHLHVLKRGTDLLRLDNRTMALRHPRPLPRFNGTRGARGRAVLEIRYDVGNDDVRVLGVLGHHLLLLPIDGVAGGEDVGVILKLQSWLHMNLAALVESVGAERSNKLSCGTSADRWDLNAEVNTRSSTSCRCESTHDEVRVNLLATPCLDRTRLGEVIHVVIKDKLDFTRTQVQLDLVPILGRVCVVEKFLACVNDGNLLVGVEILQLPSVLCVR